MCVCVSYSLLYKYVKQIQLMLAKKCERSEWMCRRKKQHERNVFVGVQFMFRSESALTHVIITSNILYKRMLFNSWSNFTDSTLFPCWLFTFHFLGLPLCLSLFFSFIYLPLSFDSCNSIWKYNVIIALWSSIFAAMLCHPAFLAIFNLIFHLRIMHSAH